MIILRSHDLAASASSHSGSMSHRFCFHSNSGRTSLCFHRPSSDEDFIFSHPVYHHRLLTDVLIILPPTPLTAIVFISKNRSSFCHYSAQKPSVAPTVHHILGRAIEGSPPDGLQHLPSQIRPLALPFTYFPDISYLLPFPPENSNYFLLPYLPVRILLPSFQRLPFMKVFLTPNPPTAPNEHTPDMLSPSSETPVHFALFWRCYTLPSMQASCELGLTTNTSVSYAKSYSYNA